MRWPATASREFRQLYETLPEDGDEQAQAFVDYAMRLAFYAGITAIFLMITALVIKLMWNFGEEGTRNERATENSRLVSPKKDGTVARTYGTDHDLESSGSSSEDDDLYDGKICVICYDDQRNCFFVPCGHCIACNTCATRIAKEESKSCPICRGIIDKIRKLQM